MADIAYDDRQLVLDTAASGLAVRQSGIGLHTTSIMLMGIAMPVVLLFAIQPSVMREAGPVALYVMAAVFAISAGIYVHSVLRPGRLASAAFDSAGRTVTLVWSGAFATTNREIHFADIAGVAMSVTAGTDGQPCRSAELYLKNGQKVPLPEGTEDSHVLAVRELLGLA